MLDCHADSRPALPSHRVRTASATSQKGPDLHSITVVGTGYVGLVTGACLADFGNSVTCVDSDAPKIERMRAGELPFFEPGVPEMVSRNVQDGRLTFDSDVEGALKRSEVVFITV